jgi:thiol-disulfide isomerase/thioredoxin
MSKKIALVVFAVFFCIAAFPQSDASVPVIRLKDLQSRITQNNDTTYIVNFWATWCAPCVKELPDFDSISRSYSKERVIVLLVSLDFKEDLQTKVYPFLQKRNLHPEVLLLDETNANYFIPEISSSWSGAIPATLILNNKKKHKSFFEKKLNYAMIQQELERIKTKIPNED